MKLLPLLFTFALGFGTCLLLISKGCFNVEKVEFVETTKYVLKDTFVYHTDTVLVPVKTTKVKTEIDSVLLKEFVNVYHVDTTFIDTSYNMVVNLYGDSIVTDSFKMRWSAETLGYLTDFSTEVELSRDSIVKSIVRVTKPILTAQVGLSNLLHPKVGLGYKGWILEAEFNPINQKPKFYQLSINKQFIIK